MADENHYTFIPMELREANEFILKYHRHNKEVLVHKFSIGLLKDGKLIGVGIVGRPISRMLDVKGTLEIRRVCIIEGNPNANSIMYSRIKKIALLLGYTKVLTYTLQSESQSSLKAVKAQIVAETKPESWNRKNRPREDQTVYKEPKFRWEL